MYIHTIYIHTKLFNYQFIHLCIVYFFTYLSTLFS